MDGNRLASWALAGLLLACAGCGETEMETAAPVAAPEAQSRAPAAEARDHAAKTPPPRPRKARSGSENAREIVWLTLFWRLAGRT